MSKIPRFTSAEQVIHSLVIQERWQKKKKKKTYGILSWHPARRCSLCACTWTTEKQIDFNFLKAEVNQ